MIDELIARMTAMLGPMEAVGDQRRYFHATYLRTTIAVAGEIRHGGFADGEWVERPTTGRSTRCSPPAWPPKRRS